MLSKLSRDFLTLPDLCRLGCAANDMIMEWKNIPKKSFTHLALLERTSILRDEPSLNKYQKQVPHIVLSKNTRNKN